MPDLNNTFMEKFRALERRKKMSDTLNMAAMVFLSNSTETFFEMMSTGVGLIADMADLDRVSVWRNNVQGNVLHTSQIYRWDREMGGTTEPLPTLTNITYEKMAASWEKILLNGESINGPVKMLPDNMALLAHGIVSVFITPIFIKGIFWGMLLCSDNHNERYFDEDCAEMLRSAAFLCANAVVRAE
ncbi:MAG: GAF domain-containing protein, partial [Treponema sp.]|nr:GAF domain-containing protein [Treponema sp.]